MASELSYRLKVLITNPSLSVSELADPTYDFILTFGRVFKGDKGETGEKGDKGDTGKKGDTGRSAYEIWLDQGHIGTESDFIASLKGEKGDMPQLDAASIVRAMGYQPANNDAVVHLNGSETIRGTKQFLGGIHAGTMPISGVGHPINDQDAATKRYVDQFYKKPASGIPEIDMALSVKRRLQMAADLAEKILIVFDNDEMAQYIRQPQELNEYGLIIIKGGDGGTILPSLFNPGDWLYQYQDKWRMTDDHAFDGVDERDSFADLLMSFDRHSYGLDEHSVHRTGDETIEGVKSFKGTILLEGQHDFSTIENEEWSLQDELDNKADAVKLTELSRKVDEKPDEAPKDGKAYTRKNGEWVEYAGGDAPAAPEIPLNEIKANSNARHTHSNKAILDRITKDPITEHQDISGLAEKSEIKCFVITEDMFTISTDATKGVTPYNTSYGYTNVDIKASAGINWVEGALYVFVLNTKVATSAYRNVRVRIGTGDYKPLMNYSSTILSGSTYFVKASTVIFQYKSTYQANGALHMHYDANTNTYQRVYRCDTDVDLPLTAGNTGGSTGSWSEPTLSSYKDTYGAVGSSADTRPTLNPHTGELKVHVGSFDGIPTRENDLVNKKYVDALATRVQALESDYATALTLL